MVVVFLKRMCLTRDGDWVTVSVELNDGLDLNGFEKETFRLNDSLPAAEARACSERLRLRFPLREVRSLFRESMKLTISGCLDDGVRVLGYVTPHSLAPAVPAFVASTGRRADRVPGLLAGPRLRDY